MSDTIIIYRPDGSPIRRVYISPESFIEETIGQRARLVLEVDSSMPMDIPVQSYVTWGGEVYTLWNSADITKHSGRDFHYTISFGSSSYLLEAVKYKFITDEPRMVKAKFPLTATPRQFLELMVRNLNERDSGWSVGTVLEAPSQVIAFSHDSCMSALSKMADAYKTEWHIKGKTIHLGKYEVERDNPLELGYGSGKGILPNLRRQPDGDKMPTGILYAETSERNIDRSQYGRDRKPEGSSVLLLPKSVRYEYEGRTYVTDAYGESVRLEGYDLRGMAEESYDGAHIYPMREGAVSRVDTIRRVEDGEAYFDYDIIDSSIPETLDYSQHRIAGERAYITFQTGRLAGQSFDIATDGDVLGYVHRERRFRLVRRQEAGVMMPEPNTFYPSVGDKYAVFGVSLPDAYIRNDADQSGAEWVLLREMARYLHEHSAPRAIYSAELDGIYTRREWSMVGSRLDVGMFIRLVDADLGIDEPIRITSRRTELLDPYSPRITLSNAQQSLSIGSTLAKLEAEEVRRESDKREVVRMARREYSEAMEAMRALEGAVEGFEGGISPVAIRTMQLIAGDQSLQFGFVASYTSRTAVPFAGEWRRGVGFVIPESHLLHRSIGVRTITTDGGDRETLRQWYLPGTTLRAVGDKPLYLYAICERETMQAVWRLSETALPFEADGQYQLLVGILGREDSDGSRAFTRLYGYTEITPGMMRGVERIVSADGSTGIDLLEGRIWGNIRFEGGKDAQAFITEVLQATPDASTDYLRQALLEGTTDIAGGLIATGIIALRGRGGDVRAYLDGRTTSGIAFGAGVSGYGTPIERRNITIRHDGSADIGEMHVEPGTGRITFVDSNGVYLSVGGELGTIQELAEHRVQTIVQQVARRELNGWYRNGEALDDRHVLIANLGEITKDGFYLGIELSGRFTHGTHGGATTLSLHLERRGGTDTIPVWQMTSRRSESYDLSISEGVVVPRGSWRLVLLAKRQEYCDWRLVGFGGEVRGSSHGNGSRGRVALSGHGLVVWLGEGNVLSLTGSDGLRYRGRVDLPGVLASGTVQGRNAESSVGGRRRYRVAQSLGAHTLLCEDGGYDGYYLITHNLGHTNYQVQLTPQAEDQAVYLSYYHSSPTAVYVYAKGANGNPIRTDFGITFVGNNQ